MLVVLLLTTATSSTTDVSNSPRPKRRSTGGPRSSDSDATDTLEPPPTLIELTTLVYAALPSTTVNHLLQPPPPPPDSQHQFDRPLNGVTGAGSGRVVAFVGDSHALRAFRLFAFRLALGDHLTATDGSAAMTDLFGQAFRDAGVGYGGNLRATGLTRGVLASPKRIAYALEPNAAGISHVVFQRAVYFSDVPRALDTVATERWGADIATKAGGGYFSASAQDEMPPGTVAIASSSPPPHLAVYLSVAAWDFIRPDAAHNGWTLDDLVPESFFRGDGVVAGDDDATPAATPTPAPHNPLDPGWMGGGDGIDGGEAAAGNRQGKKGPSGRSSGVPVEWEARRADQMRERVRAIFAVTTRLSAAGRLAPRVGVRWRWPAPPNCTSSRFSARRCGLACARLCPAMARDELPLWRARLEVAVQAAHPAAGAGFVPAPPGAAPGTATYRGRGVVVIDPDERLVECRARIDGIHPSPACVAAELATFALRAMSP